MAKSKKKHDEILAITELFWVAIHLKRSGNAKKDLKYIRDYIDHEAARIYEKVAERYLETE